MRTKRKQLAFGSGINSMGLDFLVGNALEGLGTIFGGAEDMTNPLDAMFNKMAFGGTVDPPVKKGVKPIVQDTIYSKKGNMVTKTDMVNLEKNGFPFASMQAYGEYLDTWGTGQNVIPKSPPNKAFTLGKEVSNYSYDSPDYNIPKKRLANGGTVGSTAVEVEDQEVAETPLGDIMQFQGNTHEEGGIDVNLPNGTKVFSDRISIDGKTIQERKLKREKSLKKFTKAFEANPTDIVAKNSHDRTKAGLDLEEQHDLAIQEIANRSVQPKKMALGGQVGNPWDKLGMQLFNNGVPGLLDENVYDFEVESPRKYIDAPSIQPDLTMRPLQVGTPSAPVTNADVDASSMTEGDSLGMFGNAFSAITPLLSTLGSSLSDTPNINAFQNFGEDALLANTNAKGQLAAIKTSQDQKLQLSRTGARNRNRNSAGSVNTLRALDAVTDLSGDLASNDIASSMAQQMIGLFNTQSQLENQQDMYQMQGEQQRDVADRQDKGNFDTMLGQSLADIGTGISKTGKDLNTTQANQDLIDIMADMSTNGITYVRDGKTGRLKQKKVK